MAGGGKIRITDRDNTGQMARVVNGRLLVSSTGGGGGGGDVNIAEVGGIAIGATVPVSGTVTISNPVTVTGTVTISNDPITVQQATHANLNATVRVQDSDSTLLLDVVENGALINDETGITPFFQVTSGGPTPSADTFSRGFMDEAGQIFVRADVTGVTPGTSTVALGKAEDAVHVSGSTGVMMLAVRNDAGTALAADGDYIPLITNSLGEVRTNTVVRDASNQNITLRIITEGTAKALGDTGQAVALSSAAPEENGDGSFGPGYAIARMDLDGYAQVAGLIRCGQDPTIASDVWGDGDAQETNTFGIPAIAKVDDDPSSSETDGNYGSIHVDSDGALWVRNKGDTVQTLPLNGSTRGRPIQITGTTSGTANTLHTATTTSGELDRVYITLANTSSSSVVVTIEFGTTGVGNEIDVIVPPNDEVLAVDGSVIGGAATDTIRAYAVTGSVVNAYGRVERLT